MIDLNNSHVTLLLGGIAFFLFGMSMASQALEKLMASRITVLMNKLSHSQMLAILVGIILTTLLQSSGAVTSMLVGLGSARVVTLPQVMGVIIGTAIGSCLTVQIISFNLSQYALPCFTVAFLLYFVSKKQTAKNFAQVIMGFGVLFLGLGFISSAAHFFAQNPLVQDYIQTLHSNPFLAFTISTVFCAFVHSSAVTIGIAMSLASTGAITLEDAMYWVYGANVGTTSTALMAAMGSNYIGRQVAWAHFFYKSITAVVFLFEPLNRALVSLLELLPTSIERAIANGHLLLNLISAAVFFPFIGVGSRFIERIFPKAPGEDFQAEFLSLNNYQSSALAVNYASREIMRTADIVLSMVQDSVKMFAPGGEILIDSIKDRDNKVDYLYREIKMFLLDHANKSPTAVNQNIMNMILFLSNLERAADSIDLNLTNLALKKAALKLEFSSEGWQEINEMHAQVVKVSLLAINSFAKREMYDDVIGLKRELGKTEINLRENHIGRLNRGLRESINTSSIHLDLLSEYKRIAGLLCSHAYTSPSSRS